MRNADRGALTVRDSEPGDIPAITAIYRDAVLNGRASFELVQSVDSGRLADAVNQVGQQRGSPIRVLMQVNTSGEASKSGLSPGEAVVEGERWLGLRGLRVEGVMTMAPLDADERTLRATFSGARRVRDGLLAQGHPASELSMGMSNDYEVAVEEGATMVRLGTVLFGARHA